MRPKRVAKTVYRSLYRFVPFKRQLATLLRPLPIPRRIQRRLHFNGVITVGVDDQHSFKIRSSGPIEMDMFWRGYGHGWEGISLRAWRALVPKANVILDVGSNAGVYALAAAALAPNAKIIAFEPLGHVRTRLLKNIAMNSFKIDVEESAVSDEDGWATLYQPRDRIQLASLEREEDSSTFVQTKVPTVRLDSFGQKNAIPSIDLMKIDIEGHEPAALRGMGDLLGRYRPTILIEVINDEAAHGDWALLEPLGYEAYRIDERRGLSRAASLRSKEGLNRNYLICQPGVLESHGLAHLFVSGGV